MAIQVRKYEASKVAVVYTLSGEYGILSNFYPQEIKFEGMTAVAPEALYQALKFEDPKYRRYVLAAKNPVEAKKRGRARQADYVDVPCRVAIMRTVLKLRAQDAKFRERLLSTGSQPIVERSALDQFWGARPQGNQLIGRNVLGRLLMELREQLRKQYQS